ncbi:glycoside hydrolase family 88 protein [Bacteroidales bacterium OttesenSCG-928-A17]|nr:glycoside hydrolase family 88 protein [Bacteroidales bacterium OttesenSCG-928-A17]
MKNNSDFNRSNELVEVAIPSEVDNIASFGLFDESDNSIPYQVLSSENKIVFQASLNAGESKTYTFKEGTPATATTKTYAAIMKPNSRGDIAWENDRAAFRMYCKTLLTSEPNSANGVDLWVKKKAEPIVEKMYTYADYHSEQVEGVDAYSVGGKTLGAGGVAAYVNNQLWLHNPYDKCDIIENGPLRSEFVLTYNRVEVDGDFYTKTVRITTNANGLLNKAVVKYEGKLKPMKIAAGIFLHTNTGGVQYTSESNIIGYAENKSEGTVTSSGARFYTGLYMPATTSLTTIGNQRIIYSDYAVGSEFVYYFGGGWNIFPAGEFSNDQDWFNALRNFKKAISDPLLPVEADKLPSKREVINAGISANAYWIGNNAAAPGNNLWANSVYHAANIDFYKVYPDNNYLKFGKLWATNNTWSISGGPSTSDADNHTAGQAYIDMYWLDEVKDENKIKATKAAMDYRITNNTKSDDWWWIDAMLMAMPTLTRLGVEYNDTKYYNKMYALFSNIKNKLVVSGRTNLWPESYRKIYGTGPLISGYDEVGGLYHKTDHLWWRDWGFQPDVPPKLDPNNAGSDAPKKSPNNKNIYWSRGNGWVLAAMARTLQLLPESDTHRNEYIEILQQMSAALKNCQREDGFWNMNLADANHYPGPETSGTALFTYGMAWGINNGILDRETYYPVVAKAWNGLCKKALDKSGRLSLIQNVGESPINPSGLNANVNFGIGAFLWAASEVVKLADGDMPVAPVTPPISATSAQLQTSKKILISFDDDLDAVSATNKNNYVFSGNLAISSIALQGTQSVMVTLKSSANYGKYTVAISGVQSASEGMIGENTSLTFVYPVPLNRTPPQTEIIITSIGSQDGNPHTNVMDGKLATRWSQQGEEGQWLKFDMGKDVDVSAVDIAFHKGNERKSFFDIEVSNDDETYTSILPDLTSSGLTVELERYNFPEVQRARYVKVICNSNTAGVAGEHWNSVTEARIIYTTVSSINAPEAENTIIIYPNPITDNQLVVEMSSAIENEIFLTISDLNGKTVYSKKRTPENNKLIVNDLNLSSGSYLLTVDTQKEKFSRVFIVK